MSGEPCCLQFTGNCPTCVGCRVEDFGVTREAHHLLTQVSEQTHLCLHFYGKQVSLEQLQTFEQNALKGHDYGTEVWGLWVGR